MTYSHLLCRALSWSWSLCTYTRILVTIYLWETSRSLCPRLCPEYRTEKIRLSYIRTYPRCGNTSKYVTRWRISLYLPLTPLPGHARQCPHSRMAPITVSRYAWSTRDHGSLSSRYPRVPYEWPSHKQPLSLEWGGYFYYRILRKPPRYTKNLCISARCLINTRSRKRIYRITKTENAWAGIKIKKIHPPVLGNPVYPSITRNDAFYFHQSQGIHDSNSFILEFFRERINTHTVHAEKLIDRRLHWIIK